MRKSTIFLDGQTLSYFVASTARKERNIYEIQQTCHKKKILAKRILVCPADYSHSGRSNNFGVGVQLENALAIKRRKYSFIRHCKARNSKRVCLEKPFSRGALFFPERVAYLY